MDKFESHVGRYTFITTLLRVMNVMLNKSYFIKDVSGVYASQK